MERKPNIMTRDDAGCALSPMATVPKDDWGTAIGLFSFAHELPRSAPAREEPHLEIFQRGANLVVSAALPGLTSADVNVLVDDDSLTICGERPVEAEDLIDLLLRQDQERNASFAWRIPLPPGVDPHAIEGTFENGVLEITLKLAQSPRPTQQDTRTPTQTSQTHPETPTQTTTEPAPKPSHSTKN